MKALPALSPAERRAMGMVWNGAENYDIVPPFLSFLPEGSPDFYMNTMVGLGVKWLGYEPLTTLFASYAGSSRRALFDGILWLGIEHYAYQRELPLRPHLAQLRQSYARAYFREDGAAARRRELWGDGLSLQQSARWEQVLGREPRLLKGRDKKLKEALELSGELTAEEALKALKDILIEFFRFSDFRLEGRHNPVSRGLNFRRRENAHRDSLLQRGEWETGNAAAARETEKAKADPRGDRAYIEACFGPPSLPARELERMEKALCRDAHALCHLWVCGSRRESALLQQREALLFSQEARSQAEKNAAYLQQQRIMVQAGIRRLSARLTVLLENYARELPEISVRGQLIGEKAYRLPLCQDPAVFLKPSQDPLPDLSVTLLLDASASRTRSQEMIAAQAYMLAESMMHCGIRVQVVCFRSLRGYTVLQVLKEEEAREAASILQYFAGGWNRDGLAFKSLGYLAALKEPSAGRRLLLVLTDAHPSDSTEMPPEGQSFFRRSYEGLSAVEDTAAAVAALRKKGLGVAAIFTGSHSHVEALKTIYGHHFVRIKHMEQLAQEAGSLLDQELRLGRG